MLVERTHEDIHEIIRFIPIQFGFDLSAESFPDPDFCVLSDDLDRNNCSGSGRYKVVSGGNIVGKIPQKDELIKSAYAIASPPMILRTNIMCAQGTPKDRNCHQKDIVPAENSVEYLVLRGQSKIIIRNIRAITIFPLSKFLHFFRQSLLHHLLTILQICFGNFTIGSGFA